MKKYSIKLIGSALVVLLLNILAARAQTIADNVEEDNAKEKGTALFRKNGLKMNVSSLALNNFNFNYERSLTRKISLTAGYRYMPFSNLNNLPLASQVTSRLSDDSGLLNDLNAISTGNSTITGELRFYGGRRPGARGFYLSLYGRHLNMDVNYIMDFDTETATYPIPIQSSLKGFGGGLMIGSQWLIAKRIIFDWYIIGAHYGNLKGNADVVANLSSLTAEEKIRLQEEIETLVEVGNKRYISASVNDQGVKGIAKGPFAGVRGLGFNLGFAF